MQKEEIDILEGKLEQAGYRKFTKCLSSKETRGWFKSIYSEEVDEYDEHPLLYMIEFRIWDFTKYGETEHPYSWDTMIMDGDSSYRIDMDITSPKFDIETTEKLAADLHLMLHKYTNSRLK